MREFLSQLYFEIFEVQPSMQKLSGLLKITIPPELPPIRTGASKRKRVFLTSHQGGCPSVDPAPTVWVALATSVAKKEEKKTYIVRCMSQKNTKKRRLLLRVARHVNFRHPFTKKNKRKALYKKIYISMNCIEGVIIEEENYQMQHF